MENCKTLTFGEIKMSKSKLSIDDQIKHMKSSKGILFNIVDEDAAKLFLEQNNYYFKLKSYAKNYEKYNSGPNAGKYVDLEFAYLKELSTLDMYLRKFIIKMTLDIEHFLKIKLIRDVGEKASEDGYSFVNEFLQANLHIKENIKKKTNSACWDLVQKYNDNFAIWNIVEVLSFGDFIKLYTTYYRKYQCHESLIYCLWSVKFLRNAAAHNNCLLNSLRNPYDIKIQKNREINTFIARLPGILKSTREKKMSNPIVHDFVVTLYVFNRIVTSPIRMHAMRELKVDLLENRCRKNKIYFANNEIVRSHYEFIKIIVDYFYESCI